MATRSDFTEAEWTSLQKGLTGTGMLVSLSDRDFTDSFGEAGAMAKYLANQRTAAPNGLIRELSKAHGTGFGLGTSPERLRAETLEELRSSVATLSAKAPGDVNPYRDLVLGLAQAVADAKGGEAPTEAATIAAIRDALGSA